MTTNREWLFSKPWEEQLAWLDAEHVAVSTTPLEMPTEIRWQYQDGEWTAEVGASKRDIRDFDDEHAEGRSTDFGRTSASGMDSREKLEADVYDGFSDVALSEQMRDVLRSRVHAWLDRQAAITRAERDNLEANNLQLHTLAGEQAATIDELQASLDSAKRAIAKAGGTWTEHEDGTVAVVFAPDVDKLLANLEAARAKNRALKAHIGKMQDGRHGWHVKAKELEAKLDALKRAVSDAGGMWMEEDGTVTAAFAPDVDELRAERDYWKDQVHRCVIAAVEPGGYTAGVMGYPRDGGYIAPYLLVTDAIDSLKDFYADAKREVAKYQEVVDNQNEAIGDLKAERDQFEDYAYRVETERDKYREKFGKALDFAGEIGRLAE